MFFFLLSIATSTPTEYQPFAGSSSKHEYATTAMTATTTTTHTQMVLCNHLKIECKTSIGNPIWKTKNKIRENHSNNARTHDISPHPGDITRDREDINCEFNGLFCRERTINQFICVVLSQCHLSRISLHTIFALRISNL